MAAGLAAPMGVVSVAVNTELSPATACDGPGLVAHGGNSSMHAPNPNRTCGCCGGPVPTGQESIRNLSAPPHTGVFCLRCEQMSLETDLFAAQATLGMVERLVSTALEHAAGADILATVSRVITEEGLPGREQTTGELTRALTVNSDRRMQAAAEEGM